MTLSLRRLPGENWNHPIKIDEPFFLQMKCLTILLSVLILSCSNESTDSKDKRVLAIECKEPRIDSLVANCDTTYDAERGHVKCYDKKGRMISASSTGDRDFNKYHFVYDSNGHVLYETLASKAIHCYSYRYDKNGNMIEKQGYGSGQSAIKITYEYDNGKLIKKITESGGQSEETTY